MLYVEERHSLNLLASADSVHTSREIRRYWNAKGISTVSANEHQNLESTLI